MKRKGMNQKLKKIYAGILNTLRKFSIYKRLILAFLIIIIIPNMVIGYYSFNISTREMDKNISSSTRRILGNIEKTADEKLKPYEKLALSVFSNTQLRNLLIECKSLKDNKASDPEAMKKYLDCKIKIGNILFESSPLQDINNLQIVSDYDQFIQIDYKGTKRGASIERAEEYVKRQDYLNAVNSDGSLVWSNSSKEKDIYLVEPFRKSYLGGYITLFQSIPDPQLNQSGQLGVIIINVPVKIFKDMIDLENMYDENEIVFMSGKGGTVSVLNGVYAVNKMPGTDIMNEISAIKEGSLVRKIQNKDYILVFQTSEKTDMTIVYMAERKKILSGVYNVRSLIIEVTIICIFCALVISYVVTSSISIPLRRLKKTMERVGENNLELVYHDEQRDEIGVLGDRFNAMIVRIKNLLGNLIDSEVSRKNEEIRRKEAELDALQMQIKPHFMYNTLNIIRWNAMFAEDGEGPISSMIASFSKFLRFNTINTNRLVEIREEIEHLYAYEKVLKLKKELEFAIMLDLSDEELLSSKITKLTFQPIVENAVKYGLTSNGRPGEINIKISASDADILIEITDNGVGMPKEQVELINGRLISSSSTSEGGIGLKNVNERIRLSFGQEYGLKVVSEEGRYTSVIIHIPYIKG